MSAMVLTNGNGHGNGVGGGLRGSTSSAEPILTLLEEDDDYLKAHALRALNRGNNIINHWHEVAEYVSEIEALSEVRVAVLGRMFDGGWPNVYAAAHRRPPGLCVPRGR